MCQMKVGWQKLCYYAVKLGGGEQRCRRQHSLVLGAAERQIFTVVCVITGAADLWSLEFLATYIKVLSRSDVIGR